MRLVPELSSHSIDMKKSTGLAQGVLVPVLLLKYQMKKEFTALCRLQCWRGLRHIIILKQEILMRLFLLEITAFSVMLGYFQILAWILDFKHSSNKLADQKKREVLVTAVHEPPLNE